VKIWVGLDRARSHLDADTAHAAAMASLIAVIFL
jgi:hypothetical protein